MSEQAGVCPFLTLWAVLRAGGEAPHFPEDSAQDIVDLAVWMIGKAAPWPDAACATMDRLVEMHRSRSDDKKAWRHLRSAAVELSDSDDRQTALIGKVAEAAAWPLSTSRSGLTEIFKEVAQLRSIRAASNTGWSVQDMEQAEKILTVVSVAADGSSVPREEIPARFAATEPALERRFIIQLNAGNAAYNAFRMAVAAWLEGRFGHEDNSLSGAAI